MAQLVGVQPVGGVHYPVEYVLAPFGHALFPLGCDSVPECVVAVPLLVLQCAYAVPVAGEGVGSALQMDRMS